MESVWEIGELADVEGGVRLRAASWRSVMGAWSRGAGDALAFGGMVRDVADAVFWECAPVRSGGVNAAFECVVLPAPSLRAMVPDHRTFARAFVDEPNPDAVLDFDNLGGDARLVVPRQGSRPYPHLIPFLRTAPEAQQCNFWQRIAAALAHRLPHGPSPIWLSTSGLGVAWLHVRLDSKPKYYQYAEYR